MPAGPLSGNVAACGFDERRVLFPGFTTDAHCMIKAGDTAPDFGLPDQSGNIVSLGALLEQGELVVYFYPADFTPVCTAQACAFRDIHGELDGIDIRIVGISPQDNASHERFADRYALPFPLLFDAGKRVIREYGVDGPLGFGVRRATFLIGRDGTVRHRVVSDFLVGRHVNMIRQLLDESHAGG